MAEALGRGFLAAHGIGSTVYWGNDGFCVDVALAHPQREFRFDLRNSPGYYGGLRAAVEAVGYRLDGRGRVTLTSRAVPAEALGLTEAKRAQLLALAGRRRDELLGRPFWRLLGIESMSGAAFEDLLRRAGGGGAG